MNKTLIVFGWTGASTDDIKNKIKLIQPLFLKTIIIETPVYKILFDLQYNFMKQQIKELKENLTDSQNVVLYYSGGGAIYHPLVHQELDNLIISYIFDSAPVPFGLTPFVNWTLQKYNPFITILTFIPFSLYMYSIGLFRLTYYNNYIITHEIKKTLLLTGINDPLVPINYVNTHLNKIFSNIKLFNSGHLEHDIKYPTEYFNEISNFLK